MAYWKGYPQTTYVDEIGFEVGYTKGEMEMGYFSDKEFYYFFNGYMLMAVI
jgi:hypothetical protein